MKCPECGQWNRASMPHCQKCGAPLNIDGASRLEWKDSLKDDGPATKYIRVDEDGQANSAPDSRDALAREMQDLKKRKREGEEKKRQMLESRGRGDGEDGEKQSAWEEIPGGDKNTVRMRRVSKDGLAAERESEIRHRVRFMDDAGAFIEPRTYDRLYDDPMADHHYSYAPSLSGKMRSRSEGRKKGLKVFLTLLLVAMLGAGGYFTYRFFADRRVSTDSYRSASDHRDDHGRPGRAHDSDSRGRRGADLYPRAARELCRDRRVRDGAGGGPHMVRQLRGNAGGNHGRDPDAVPQNRVREADAAGPHHIHDLYSAEPHDAGLAGLHAHGRRDDDEHHPDYRAPRIPRDGERRWTAPIPCRPRRA